MWNQWTCCGIVLKHRQEARKTIYKRYCQSPAMGSLVRNSTSGFGAAATELSSSLSDNHSLNLCSSASRFKSQMGIAKWPSLVQLPIPYWLRSEEKKYIKTSSPLSFHSLPSTKHSNGIHFKSTFTVLLL